MTCHQLRMYDCLSGFDVPHRLQPIFDNVYVSLWGGSTTCCVLPYFRREASLKSSRDLCSQEEIFFVFMMLCCWCINKGESWNYETTNIHGKKIKTVFGLRRTEKKTQTPVLFTNTCHDIRTRISFWQKLSSYSLSWWKFKFDSDAVKKRNRTVVLRCLRFQMLYLFEMIET